jgi:hypothetical protein
MKHALYLALLVLTVPLVLSAKDEAAKKQLKKGAVLTSSGSSPVLVCHSRDKCKEYVNAVQLGRQGQINTIRKNRNNHLVPVGTKVRVINYDPQYCRIRVLEGQFKHKTGWVATTNLKPAPLLDKNKKERTE